MRRLTTMLACAAMLVTSSCAGLQALMTGPPPTAAVLNSTQIDETAIDLVRDLFDVGLYAVDALTDAGQIVPRSPQAVRIAHLIRQISGFLGTAESARQAGSAATYAEALRQARNAVRQFQQAIGMPATTAAASIPSNNGGARVLQ